MLGTKSETEKNKKIKCVVWDLDNTIWNGILLESNNIVLREDVVEIIKCLDSKGVLQSIASKNEYEIAMNKLNEFGISEYFLYPQINWNSKSSSLEKISKCLNIGIDTFAFIDDQLFELEEVKFSHPDVLCINADNIGEILDMEEMNPRFITEDSKQRRLMYRADIQRKNVEAEFQGPQEEFLASLKMVFNISKVKEEDLKRAEELTVRTNQLNTTGYTYSYEELDELRCSEKQKLLIASLDDRFGSYGKIGLSLIECDEKLWTIKLLLMSCRVVSRGVGSIMLNHIIKLAKEAGVTLQAQYTPNGRNRLMYITYKFAGFKDVAQEGDTIILESDLDKIQPFPEYIDVVI